MIGRRICFGCWLLLLAAGWFAGTAVVFPALFLITIAAAGLLSFLTWRQSALVQVELSLSGSGRQADGRLHFVYKGFLPVVTVETAVNCRNCLTGDTETALVRCTLSKERPSEAALQLGSRYCGRLEISAEQMRITDPLGLTTFKRPCRLRQAVLILPEEMETDLAEELVRTPDMEGVDFAGDRPGFDPSETFAIREYRAGDRLKSVHWKLSGKLDQLMVREPGLPVKNSNQILMETCFREEDPEKRKQLIDRVCCYTVALCEQLVDAGVGYQLGWMDYRENTFHNCQVTGADDLLELLPALLSAEVTFGTETVREKFYEEEAGQEMSGLIVIDDETIRQ